jgi:hypothetical protein
MVRDQCVGWQAHDVTSLRGPNAVRATIEAAVADADLVTASGHGEYDVFIGDDGDEVWADQHAIDQLAGKVVHLLACRSAASLGTRAVEAGARAFWGYTADFLLWPDWTDQLLGMDAELLEGLLAGLDAKAVHQRVTEYVTETVTQILPTDVQRSLLSNYAALARPGSPWGDGNAVV